MAALRHRLSAVGGSEQVHHLVTINPQLYAYAFTAHGRGARWCPVCHMDGEQHTFDCPKFALSSPLPFTRPPTRAFSVPTQRPLLPSPVPPAISARLGPPPGRSLGNQGLGTASYSTNTMGNAPLSRPMAPASSLIAALIVRS